MVARDKGREGISFSMSEPSLRAKAPLSLRRAGPLRHEFIAANDQTEKKPIGERTNEKEVSGSQMVKRQKPFPELRPKHSYAIKKSSFNQEWIKEQRKAQLENFKTMSQTACKEKQQPAPLLTNRNRVAYERN